MISVHWLDEAEQEVSSIVETAAAEVREWKKEFESSRNMETGWQFVTVELERKSVKNFSQFRVKALTSKLVSKGLGIAVDVALAAKCVPVASSS